MFTVKLFKGHDIKLVSGVEINVFPAGAANPNEKYVAKEIEVKGFGGVADGRTEVYWLADPNKPRPAGFADEVQFFDCAYIENQHGATTQVVRPY